MNHIGRNTLYFQISRGNHCAVRSVRANYDLHAHKFETTRTVELLVAMLADFYMFIACSRSYYDANKNAVENLVN